MGYSKFLPQKARKRQAIKTQIYKITKIVNISINQEITKEQYRKSTKPKVSEKINKIHQTIARLIRTKNVKRKTKSIFRNT